MQQTRHLYLNKFDRNDFLKFFKSNKRNDLMKHFVIVMFDLKNLKNINWIAYPNTTLKYL